MRKFLVALLFAGLCLYGCNDCEPVTPPGNELVLLFFSYEEIVDETPSFTFKSPTFNQIYETGTGLPIDFDRVIEDSLRQYRYLLPLPFDSLAAGFVFESTIIDDSDPDNLDTLQRFDTLSVSYSRQMIVVSPDCGFYEEITDLQITQSTFDSAAIFLNSLQANDTTNLLIFH